VEKSKQALTLWVMDKNEFKKYFNSQVRFIVEEFNSSLIAIDYSKNIVEIKYLDNVIGKIEFKFLTGNQLSTGSVASIFLSANVSGGEIWEEILRNDLIQRKNSNPYTNYLYYFYSSSSNNCLFKNSKTDFFLGENIEDKVGDFLSFISKEILLKVYNILTQKDIAVDDILNTPNYYGQPEISILLLCKNNNDLLLAVESDKRFLNSPYINKKNLDD
jgi:hypothetical protein